MVERTRVGELRQATTLNPTARPVQSYNRPEEPDQSKSRRLEQLSSALDKVAGVAEDYGRAQFEQRSRMREADQVLISTKKFTDWSQSLDQSMWNLPPEQFQAKLDQEFTKFSSVEQDPNLQIAYKSMYGDFYSRQVGANTDTFRERQNTERMALLTDRLWSAVKDPSLDAAGRNAAIEEVIGYAANEYNLPRNVLNDWLVQQQFDNAKLLDSEENFAILDWMKANKIDGIGRYSEQVSYINSQKATVDGIEAEVKKSLLMAELEQRRNSGIKTDRAYFDQHIKSGLLTAGGVESILADEAKLAAERQTAIVQNAMTNQTVIAIVGGNGGYGLPQNVLMDTEFQTAAQTAADNLNVPLGWLYGIISFETGGTFNPAEVNKAGSGATGLIQFMPETAQAMGTTVEKLSKMTRSQQMAIVEQYYKPYVGKIKSPSDMYMATLYPYALDQGDDYVLGSHISTDRVTSIARQNAIFDTNGDGKITKGEVAAAYSSSANAAMFTMNNGDTLGVAGLGTQDLTMADGSKWTVAQQRTQAAASYAQQSAAVAAARKETPVQTINREITEFWGRTGGTMVNPQWKQVLEAGFNLSRSQDGSGGKQHEVSTMAYGLYRQMTANSPHIVNAYTTPEMRDYFEAVATFQDDLKFEPEAAFNYARNAMLAAGSASAVEGREQAVKTIIDKSLFADNGWFFTNIGASKISNVLAIKAHATESVDRLIAAGLNPAQAEEKVKERIKADFTPIGSTLVRTDGIKYTGGVPKFISDMNEVMNELNADPIYTQYFKSQGIEGDSIVLVQSTTNDNEFLLLDANRNPIPHLVEYEGEYIRDLEKGLLMIRTSELPTLANRAWTAKRERESKD